MINNIIKKLKFWLMPEIKEMFILPVFEMTLDEYRENMRKLKLHKKGVMIFRNKDTKEDFAEIGLEIKGWAIKMKDIENYDDLTEKIKAAEKILQ